jgi:hypothetical protein
MLVYSRVTFTKIAKKYLHLLQTYFIDKFADLHGVPVNEFSSTLQLSRHVAAGACLAEPKADVIRRCVMMQKHTLLK